MQPRLGQLPGQGGPSGLSVKWPSSAPRPCAPRKVIAVDHHPAAHAGAEREHHEVVLAEYVGLGESGAVGVVVDEHRHAEAPAELLAQRHAGERDVHARLDRAGGVVDLRGHADADRLGLAGPARSRRARWPRSRRAGRLGRPGDGRLLHGVLGRSRHRPPPRRPSCRPRPLRGPRPPGYSRARPRRRTPSEARPPTRRSRGRARPCASPRPRETRPSRSCGSRGRCRARWRA